MLGVSLLLVWIGAVSLSQFLHNNQMAQIREDIDKRSALFSTTLMDALISEDIPILETSLAGLVEIHDNLIGAEFCNYENRPLLRWGEDIPSCNLQQAAEESKQQQIVTSYREILFEGERFGAIALRWDMDKPYQQLQQQIQGIVGLLVVAVLLLALVLFVLVRFMVVRPIRRVDHYLRQVESSELASESAGSYSSRELVHLCEGVMALLQSMAAEAKLRDEREELLATLEEKVVERTQDLKRSNDQLSSIMENMGDALFVLGEQREILVTNPAAERLFQQLDSEQDFSVGFERLFPSELKPLIDKILSSQKLYSERLLFSDDQQNKVLLELTCSPLPVGEDRLHRLILLRDVTRQHDQEEREQMIAFRSGVAEVSASMKHNIGNQLAGVNGKIYQIKGAEQAVVKTADFLLQMAEQIEQMPTEKSKLILEHSGKVLNDTMQKQLHGSIEEIESTLLKIAETIRRQEEQSPSMRQLSRFHPRSFFKESAGMLQKQLRKQGVELEIVVEEGLNEVHLPRNQLQLNFLALLTNAIEAIKEGDVEDGVIRVDFRSQKREGQPGFLLQIEDNGVGVESEQLEHLFAAGYSSKGMPGHGLHSSGNFVKSMKGEILLKSEGLGKGATVEIWLPEQGTLSAAS